MKFKDIEDYSYVREHKKQLPYTIVEVPNLAEFKAWKLKKELESQAKQAKKRAEVIKGMEDGSLAAKDAAGGYGKSETTKVYERFTRFGISDAVRFGIFDAVPAPTRGSLNQYLSERDAKLPIITRIYNWCIDQFLNVKL